MQYNDVYLALSFMFCILHRNAHTMEVRYNSNAGSSKIYFATDSNFVCIPM